MDIQTVFSDKQLEELVVEAVQKVVNTMLALEAKYSGPMEGMEQLGQPLPTPIQSNQNLIAGSVGFSGTVSGVIYLYMEEGTCLSMASKMLGMTEADIKKDGNEMINDALGEIANMTVGSFKNRICDLGYNCKLTIPSILRGKGFSIESAISGSKVIRKFYKFDIEGAPYVVDLLMKKETE
jgi:chemotaxis protein CheX